MNRRESAKKEKHEFALFVESLGLLIQTVGPGQIFIISDEQLVHRITIVLRLGINDNCVVFDRTLYASCIIVAFVGKKQIHMKIQSKQCTIAVRPAITFLLPLLKKDDYEGALYALVEIGVTTIQLVSTQKTAGTWSDDHSWDRAQRIIIAAAEQSKNYCFPVLKAPVALDVALRDMDTNESVKIFFDPAGKQCFSVMQMLHGSQPHAIVLLIGPEGDLSVEEKEIVRKKNFIFCALTPTIVRAVQAAALGAGLVRSLL